MFEKLFVGSCTFVDVVGFVAVSVKREELSTKLLKNQIKYQF